MRGAREEHPAVVADSPIGHRGDAQQLGESGELRDREGIQATLLTLCDHEPALQVAPKPRRHGQPALVVEARGVRAEKHRHPPPSTTQSTSTETARYRCSPQCPTVPHLVPPSTPTPPPIPHCGLKFRASSPPHLVAGGDRYSGRFHRSLPIARPGVVEVDAAMNSSLTIEPICPVPSCNEGVSVILATVNALDVGFDE